MVGGSGGEVKVGRGALQGRPAIDPAHDLLCTVQRWTGMSCGSAHPVGILWPEMDTALVAAGVDLPVPLPLSARGVLDVRVARQVRDK
jgi:hypothetical protein